MPQEGFRGRFEGFVGLVGVGADPAPPELMHANVWVERMSHNPSWSWIVGVRVFCRLLRPLVWLSLGPEAQRCTN